MNSRRSSAQLVRLDRRFFRQDAVRVARALLGQRLVRIENGRRLAGLIVETEAYLGEEDKAAHSFGGRRTNRTEPMYGDGGTVYVFLNYGIHCLLNFAVQKKDQPHAVLIRALEPTEGLERMQQHRPAAKHATDLCSGPGKLAAALAIDRSWNHEDAVTSQRLFVERLHHGNLPDDKIVSTARIGVDYAAEWAAIPLRFYLRNNPHVSVVRAADS
ncbi:MAG: DNA-3-methyladenine glycosylase [Planctomycetales bacterium]|nr:DNA-3-methyladenine glycosylase [Planctomycetales bacterium]